MIIIITIIIVLEYLFLEKDAGTNPCGWYRCWTKPLSPIAVVSLENCLFSLVVFHKCFWLFEALITFIFIIIIVRHWGLSAFLSSFQVHFFKLIFSDNQGNGTVSNMLAIIMWPLSGSRAVVACCVTHIWRTTFLFSWCWMSLFFTLCLDLLTYAKQTNHQETTKKQKTETVINFDLTLGLKWRLGKQNKCTDKRREVQTMRNTK